MDHDQLSPEGKPIIDLGGRVATAALLMGAVECAVLIGSFALSSVVRALSTGEVLSVLFLAVLLAGTSVAVVCWLRPIRMHRYGTAALLVLVAAGCAVTANLASWRGLLLILPIWLIAVPAFLCASLLVRRILPPGSAAFQHFAASALLYALAVAVAALVAEGMRRGLHSDNYKSELVGFAVGSTALIGILVNLLVSCAARFKNISAGPSPRTAMRLPGSR